MNYKDIKTWSCWLWLCTPLLETGFLCVAVAVLELSVPPRPDKAPFQGDASFQNYILVENIV